MTGKREILAVVGLLVFCAAGCGQKEKAALRQKEEMIRILQKQIETLRLEIDTLRQSLAEKEGLAIELAELLRQARTQAAEPPAVSAEEPGSPQLAAAQPQAPPPTAVRKSPLGEALAQTVSRQAGSVSPEDQIALLKRENQRLQAELDELRALLVQTQTATAAASVQPAVPAAFANPKISSAYESFAQSPSASGRVEILESLQDYAAVQDREVLPILDRALDDPDPEVGRTAAGMFEPYHLPEVLPLIEKALKSRDEDTRLNALAPLEQIRDPKAAELAALALSDPSQAVRSRALEVIRGQSEDIQILSLSRAMGSVAEEVKSDVLSLLELRGDKPAVEVILTGLKDPSPQFREEVKGVLQFLLDQEFRSYDQAMRWWKANQAKYDENLFEK